MTSAPARFADLRELFTAVARYLLRLLIDSLVDLVRIPVAIVKALFSLLSARAKPTRQALLILLLDAAREMVLIPLSLSAAGLDVLLSFQQVPRYFYATQQLGQRWARRLDRWFVSSAHLRSVYVLKRWHDRLQRRRTAANSEQASPAAGQASRADASSSTPPPH